MPANEFGQSYVDREAAANLRRYEMRREIARICEEAEFRDKLHRRMEMRLRFESIKAEKLG